MYTRRAFDGATRTLFHQIVDDCAPRDANVLPLSADANTSFGLPLSAVPTQISPVGPISSASIHSSAMRFGSFAGSSAVAVAKLQPPSRDTRSPVNVVAKIVPSV